MRFLGCLVALLLWSLPAGADAYRPITSYELGTTTTAATSPETIGSYTQILRLLCDTDCLVAFAASGTDLISATSGAIRLEADLPEYFKAFRGSRIFVGSWASGTLFITEME